MDLNLKGKVIFVSGSSRGIGLAIAKTLWAEGAHLIINGRSEKDLKLALESFSKTNFDNKVYSVLGDCSDSSASSRFRNFVLDKFSRIDGLVCNVGSGKSLPAGEETWDEMNTMNNLNFGSAFHLIQEFKRDLIKSKGSIVCVSSICGQAALGAPIAYSVAKASLDFYVKSSARVLGKNGVRINAVAPGNIMFKGSTWEKKATENHEDVNQMLKNEVSLQRFGSPEEIAFCVAFLLSSLSSFVTGHILVADGGQLRK